MYLLQNHDRLVYSCFWSSFKSFVCGVFGCQLRHSISWDVSRHSNIYHNFEYIINSTLRIWEKINISLNRKKTTNRSTFFLLLNQGSWIRSLQPLWWLLADIITWSHNSTRHVWSMREKDDYEVRKNRYGRKLGNNHILKFRYFTPYCWA